MDYRKESSVAVLDPPKDYGTATREKARALPSDVLKEMGKRVKSEEIIYRQSGRE